MMSKSKVENEEEELEHIDQLALQMMESEERDFDKCLPGEPVILLKKRRIKQSKKAPTKQRFPTRSKYFTAGSNIDESNKRCLDKEPSPFSYPRDLDELAHRILTKAWRNDVRLKELKTSYRQKTSFKGRMKADKLNRLYVEKPPIESMKTVLDIDPQYFKVIEGRPIPEILSVREYIDTNRECLRTRIINGYREDDITLMEENLVTEQNRIDRIKRNYEEYVNIFEEFLYKDHSTAKELLAEADQTANDAYDRYCELKAWSKKYDAVKSSLYNSEQKWRNCKLYQKFLHNISPISWRNQQGHSISSKRISVYVRESDREDESDLFGQFRQSIAEKEPSLTEILTAFREEFRCDGPAHLYFTEPEQLLEVFQYMQMQNLNSLLYAEEMAIPLENIKEAMKEAEKLFDEGIRSLFEEISLLEVGIQWEENRAKYMEELGKNLIDRDFKAMVMDNEVLNLHVFVEDTYETRIGANDANLNILEMMRAIEMKYRDELLSFDKIPSDQIALLEGSCYQEQMTVMQLAEMAAKEFANMEKLNYRLMKAFEPPFKKASSKDPKKRSPPVEPPVVVLPPPRDLTEKEEEYLEYFTDFCKYSDDPKNYGIDTRSSKAFTGMVRQTYEEKSFSKQKRFKARMKGVETLENVIRANT